MTRAIRFLVSTAFLTLTGSAWLFGQQAGILGGVKALVGARASTPSIDSCAYVQSYYYPSSSGYGGYGAYGGYGGYFSPFLHLPSLPPPYPYMPNYWWTGAYAATDPRQAGYNPNAGYPQESVTTLLLVTIPAKTRIILDGIYVGSLDYLGPIQLPIGEHTLRVEAAGYEPSETVLRIEQPVLQQLEVHLSPIAPRVKPAARP